MSRLATLLFGAGAVLMLGLVLLWYFSIPVLPSMVAAWLFVVSLSAGALPILCGLDVAGHGGGPSASALRRCLATWPLGILLALPAIAGMILLRHRLPGHDGGWLLAIRSGIYLLVWACLAALLRRSPDGQRRGALCVLGLIAYALTATLAACDWIGAAEPGVDLASLGLLFMAGQASMAAAAARLLGAPATVLVGVTGLAWGFVDFIRFLTIWSADKADEIIYYQHRQTMLGQGVCWLELVAVSAALLATIPGPLSRYATAAAALMLLAHAADLFWMVTPATRGVFTFTLPDLVALPCALALLAGALAWRPAAERPA